MPFYPLSSCSIYPQDSKTYFILFLASKLNIYGLLREIFKIRFAGLCSSPTWTPPHWRASSFLPFPSPFWWPPPPQGEPFCHSLEMANFVAPSPLPLSQGWLGKGRKEEALQWGGVQVGEEPSPVIQISYFKISLNWQQKIQFWS